MLSDGDSTKRLPIETIAPSVRAEDFAVAFSKVQPSVSHKDLGRYRSLQRQLRSYGAHIQEKKEPAAEA